MDWEKEDYNGWRGWDFTPFKRHRKELYYSSRITTTYKRMAEILSKYSYKYFLTQKYFEHKLPGLVTSYPLEIGNNNYNGGVTSGSSSSGNNNGNGNDDDNDNDHVVDNYNTTTTGVELRMVRPQGIVYCWGNDQYLFHRHKKKNTKQQQIPQMMKSLRAFHIVELSCSGYHCLAVNNLGQVYVWGVNEDYRLGLGHNKSPIYRPCELSYVQENDLKVRSVSACLDHSALLAHNGSIYCWGCTVTKKSQIVKSVKNQKSVPWSNRTKPFVIWSKSRATRMANCYRRMLVIDSSHRLYMIGQSLQYENEVLEHPQPLLSHHLQGVASVVIGTYYLIILLHSGEVLSRDKGDSLTFSKVIMHKESPFRRYTMAHPQMKVVSIMGCEDWCVATTNTDEIYIWKPPKTTAEFVGSICGLTDVAVCSSYGIACDTFGDCWTWKIETKGKNASTTKPRQVSNLTQVGRVFAATDTNTLLAIQTFLWPSYNNYSNKHNHTLQEYCQRLLLQQIHPLNIISLFREAIALNFEEMKIYLMNVMTENIEHLLPLILKECEVHEVEVFEAWFHERHPKTCSHLYDTQQFKHAQELFAEFELIPSKYKNVINPNYKAIQKPKPLSTKKTKHRSLEFDINMSCDEEWLATGISTIFDPVLYETKKNASTTTATTNTMMTTQDTTRNDEVGYSRDLNYDLYQRPKNEKDLKNKVSIFREFNVKAAIQEDEAKNARLAKAKNTPKRKPKPTPNPKKKEQDKKNTPVQKPQHQHPHQHQPPHHSQPPRHSQPPHHPHPHPHHPHYHNVGDKFNASPTNFARSTPTNRPPMNDFEMDRKVDYRADSRMDPRSNMGPPKKESNIMQTIRREKLRREVQEQHMNVWKWDESDIQEPTRPAPPAPKSSFNAWGSQVRKKTVNRPSIEREPNHNPVDQNYDQMIAENEMLLELEDEMNFDDFLRVQQMALEQITTMKNR